MASSFGQHVEPLHLRIRNILRDYPLGVGIVQELLQNADDAGATRVTLLFDDEKREPTADSVSALDC
jgi:hypothetical protein